MSLKSVKKNNNINNVKKVVYTSVSQLVGLGALSGGLLNFSYLVLRINKLQIHQEETKKVHFNSIKGAKETKKFKGVWWAAECSYSSLVDHRAYSVENHWSALSSG